MLLYDSSLPWTWRAAATPGRGLGGQVQRRALMRILAVAQRAEALVQDAAEGAPFRRGFANLPRQPVRDRSVVDGGPGVGLLRHPAAEGEGCRPAVQAQFVDQPRIVVDIDDHGDVVVVLCPGADHRRAADVDILDPVLERGAPGKRLLERIEIDDQKVDRRDVVGDHRRLMGGLRADREQAAVHPRVQRLDSPIHHLGEPGDLRHVDDRKAGAAQRRRRTAGRDQFDAGFRERARQIDEARLVGDRQERPPDPDDIGCHFSLAPEPAARMIMLRCNSMLQEAPEPPARGNPKAGHKEVTGPARPGHCKRR